MSTRIVASLILVVLAACGASVVRKPLTDDFPAAPLDPDDYLDVTEDWTRTSTLRGQYQEVLEVAATLKSPEWRAAHAARDAEHRGLVGAARDQRIAQAKADAAGPFEFQLMVTTWDRRENDLDRGQKSTWRVRLLDANGNEIEPLEIIKDRRPAFVVRTEFPAFGDFAQAYILRFPREANVLGPNVKQVRLRVSGERGGLEVSWDAP
jgi:hypothetical protein